MVPYIRHQTIETVFCCMQPDCLGFDDILSITKPEFYRTKIVTKTKTINTKNICEIVFSLLIVIGIPLVSVLIS